ncbi:MAG: mechanosensitive ion channel family protein [Verrucomicrobiales bacterium]
MPSPSLHNPAEADVPAADEPFGAAAEAFNDRLAALAQDTADWLASRSWMPEGAASVSANAVLLAGVLVLAWISFVILRPLVLRGVHRIVEGTSTSWDDHLFGFGVFRWLTHVFPALLLLLITPGLFADAPILARILQILASLYLIMAGFFTIDSLLNALHSFYQDTAAKRRISLGPFLQVAKLLFALVGLILGLAIVIGKSPLVLLGGLGVFASVLLLVFKDVILGFVAGVQLSSNRMLTVGDWLEMPSHSADGDVEEIGLTTVKVRNWDKTITTIPSYALISEPFKNWRGMSESGGRRIKRSLLIDTNSIRLCDDAMLERFRRIEHVAKYLQRKEEEIAEWNATHRPAGETNRVNGRRLTNIGTFRAYIEGYLRNHPDINQAMTLLVRQLAPEGQGLPVEIYCFSANQNWADYESIQADIFDHLLAIAPEFDLRVFQQPSGTDFGEALRGGAATGGDGGKTVGDS